MSQDSGDGVVRREIDSEEPAVAVAEVVAELEGKDATEIPTVYGCIDHMIDHVFSNPPSPEAGVKVGFSYAGYRITVEQNGTATFVEEGDAGASSKRGT